MQAALRKVVSEFVDVFSCEQSFLDNRFVGSYVLNLCGFHVVRMLVSHALFHFRLLLLLPLVDKADRKAFREQGYLVKPNFLPEAAFAALKEEICNYKGEVREINEGDTLTERVWVPSTQQAALPECHRLIQHQGLSKLMRYVSSKNRIPLFHLENIIQHHEGYAVKDLQKDPHTDTFHPTVKGWLFMNDVDENGPFQYIPTSHRLSWEKIKWQYRESLISAKSRQARIPGRYWTGAFRVSEQDRVRMNLPPIKAFKVPANTLVIANTHGFHCRGHATKKAHRLAIWMQMRDNPFNPFPLPFPYKVAKLFDDYWRKESAKTDASMLSNGKLAGVKLAYKQGGFTLKRPK